MNENQTPDYDVRVKVKGSDKYVTVGAAWSKDSGGFYVRLNGNQLVTSGLYVLPRDTGRSTLQEDDQEVF